MRIAITGATGLVGRNLLLEILKSYWPKLDHLEVLLLGRGTPAVSLRGRVEQILSEEATDYLNIPPRFLSDILSWAGERLVCLDCDLDSDSLGITSDSLDCLVRETIDLFFHVAASTDLRDSGEVRRELQSTNIQGTDRILSLISSLHVCELAYVGSAYQCGAVAGEIAPDYINLGGPFRNPYEESKLQAELRAREFAKRTGTKCRFFRPSIVSGKLMEQLIGRTQKFDVFYGWAAFFLRLKLAANQSPHVEYSEPCSLDVRICCSRFSGLNIVPADFAAKVMWQTCIQEAPGDSFHLVNEQETRHTDYIPWMLQSLGISGTQFVERVPERLNRLEAIYYKTVGRIFTPYITAPPMHFTTDNLDVVQRVAGLRCPPINETNFKRLMAYAVSQNFGIETQ